MSAAASAAAPPAEPALRGHLRLAAAARADGTTYIADQAFRAPFHLGKPYRAGAVLHAQIVNSTAGILAGDELSLEVAAGAGAALAVTTPAAARAFMMTAGAAACRQVFAAGPGAWLEYLPEALYPHTGTDFAQHTLLQVDPAAAVFWVDQLAPGRTGRAECWAWRRLRLGLDVRLGGTLLLRERLDADGPALRALAGFHGFAEAWFATAIVAAPGLPADNAAWEPVRALHTTSCWCGVTALAPQVRVVRLVAAGGLLLRDAVAELRRRLVPLLPHLATDLRRL